MNIAFKNSIIFILVICSTPVFAQPILWPILSTDDPCLNNNPPNGQCWRTVNCTLGEIHGANHFHGAIDIDTADNVPVRAVAAGRVLSNSPQNPDTLNHVGCGNRMVTLEHGPIVNGRYTRRARYLHINPDCQNLPLGLSVAAGTVLGEVGTLDGEHHLHFELWQYETATDTWYKLNPLGNDVNWELRYHQTLEGREDGYSPEINDIYLSSRTGRTAQGQQQEGDNGTASGFFYNQNEAVGLSTRIVDNVEYCRAHLATTQYSQFSTGATIQYPEDRLVVFGNIGLTANARDVGINSIPGPGAATSSGEGLTVKHLQYFIANQLSSSALSEKYEILFDRINYNERNNIDQIFNLGFDAIHINYGNNDFIEIMSPDDEYLSPYPHPLLDTQNGPEQSNGIWFTKARGDTEHIFRYTPDVAHIAKCNIGNFSDDPLIREAKYPDGEYTLKFFAQDDYGHVNRDDTGRDVDAQLNVIVDNFRPFVQDVKITSGSDTFPMYSSAWNWETTSRQLQLRPNAVDKKADMGQPLHIAVTTSEPMKLTTDADGQPNGSMKIKLFAVDPQDQNRIKVYLDWDDEAARPRSVNEGGTEWNFFVPHAKYANLTGGFENYTQFVQIKGTDLAG